jgi:hypothetical protein
MSLPALSSWGLVSGRDENGLLQPIEGATVMHGSGLGDPPATTSETGFYAICSVVGTGQTRSVTAQKLGYEPVTHWISGELGEVVDFELTRTAFWPGTVIANGSFDNGLDSWQMFSTPAASDILADVAEGVLRFYRATPPAGSINQAVVFQTTPLTLADHDPLIAQFDLGNSSSVRKRISIVIHNADFTDLAVCTFWLPPGAPLSSYGMRTHTTQPWAGTTISFYAATAGSDGGFYLVDNVSLRAATTQSRRRTDCLDATAPSPPGGDPGPNLISNGTFAGTSDPWSVYGNLTWQLDEGAFAFIRPTSDMPAGVLLQATGQSVAAGEILTATFQLGNTSAMRKRVTVLLHDQNFTDLSACTFWLAPGQGLWSYSMRSFATRPWANATLSFYAATIGPEGWTLLDNVTFRRTPGVATTGADCVEPAQPMGPFFAR